MKVCIEVLLTLGARELYHELESLDWFVDLLAQNHNSYTSNAYPSMLGRLRNEVEDDDCWSWPCLEWSITDKKDMMNHRVSFFLFKQAQDCLHRFF